MTISMFMVAWMTKEQNKLIAIIVMGWELYSSPDTCWEVWKKDGKAIYNYDFNPLTYANDDQIVLNHIRETWTDKQWFEFSLTYYNMLAERDKTQEIGGVSLILKHHKPGDYSRAALKVLEEG